MPTNHRRYACLLLLVGSLLAPATRVSAQTFPTTLEGFSILSQSTSAPVRSTVALTAPYRAVCVGTTLQVVDESDPSNLRVVSQVVLPSPANDLKVKGSYLYIADGHSGLVVMDVSNPLTPNYVSGFKSTNPLALAINTGGEYLYLCNGTNQIHVVHVKDPYHPKTASYLSVTNGNIFDVMTVDKYLIASAGPKGLIVYKLGAPNRPVHVKRFKTLRATGRIALNGTLMAVADGDVGLALVNWPKWTDPHLKGSLLFSATPTDVLFLSDPTKVAVALGNGGYATVDITDPTTPVSLFQSATPSPVTRVSDGVRPYMVCDATGLYSLNVANPAQPVASLALSGLPPYGAVAIQGNIAFISRSTALEAWDFQDPVHPVKLGSMTTPALATDLLLDGNLLLAGCQQGGVLILDITNPAAPVTLSLIAVSGSAGQLALSGNMLAIADGLDGALLYDITAPSAPIQLGAWNSKSGYVGGVAFSGPTTLWAAQSAYGLNALDVSTPSAINVLGKLILEGTAGRIYSYSHYIYAMGGYVGWHIVDAASPAKPAKVLTLSTEGAIQATFLGSTMGFCDGNMGFREYDLTDPENPVLLSFFGAPTFSYQAGFLENGARLLSCREGGLWSLQPTSCDGNLLKLPCDGDTLSRFFPAAFTWKPVSGDKYAVQICQEPNFPSGKIITSASKFPNLKDPYWQAGTNEWDSILKKAKKHTALYWRVAYEQGSHKSFSETRTIYIP